MARQHISRVSRSARIALFLPLPLIALVVWWSGRHPREGLFESRALRAGTQVTGDDRTWLPKTFPNSGFALTDTVHTYTAETLYEKIDGHDAAFLRFGFVALTFATYADRQNRSVDVYVYRMDRRENALGIYAAERSDERQNLALAEAGYRAGGAVFFYRGPYYLQVIPAEPEAIASETITEIVDAFTQAVPMPAEPLGDLRWFPDEGSIPNSDGFFPNQTFGTDFVGEIFTRQYRVEDDVVTAFRHQSDTAAAMFSRYDSFLRQSAESHSPITVAGVEVRRYTSYGEEIWIFALEDVFGGVMGQFTEPSGIVLLERLLAALRGERRGISWGPRGQPLGAAPTHG